MPRRGGARGRATALLSAVRSSLLSAVLVGASVTACMDPPAADPSPTAEGAAPSGGPAGTRTGGPVAPPKTGAAPPSGARAITIDRVIDGDSLEVLLDDGTPQEFRLEGINAPELNGFDGRRTCAGETARDELVALLAQGDVAFTGEEIDRFGRRLVVLYVDGRPVDRALVASGWALALWSADDPELTATMIDAAEGARGWWGPSCGSPAASGVRIGDTQANAPGDDRDHLDEEWVEIVNDGPAPVDLADWVIRDDTTSNRFPLPSVTLAPGARLRVITGSGTDGDGLLHLGEDFPVWSNGGESVLLVDPEGVVAAHAFI